MKNKRIDFIQALRWIAALLVVLFHCFTLFDTNLSTIWQFLFGSWSIWVDLFFLISGFIMIYTSHKHRHEKNYPKKFFIDRVIRVRPIYAIATILRIVINRWLSAVANPEVLHQLIQSLLFIPKDLWAAGPFFNYSTLYVGRTLNYEMLFYFVFGISLFFQKRRIHALFAIFAGLLIIAPLSTWQLTLNAFQNYQFHFQYLNLASNPIIREFLIWATFWLLYLSKFTIKNKLLLRSWLITGFGIFITQYFFNIMGNHGITGWWISCSIILFFLLFYHKSYNIKTSKILSNLGKTSYSLYLLHTIIFVFLETIFIKLWIERFTHTIWFLIIIVFASIFTSQLSYQLIEKRLWLQLKKTTDKILFH